MLKKLGKIYDEKVISLFYILLPIIEVMTTYMITHMNTSITIGVVYKTLFLMYAVFYLVFINKTKRKSTFALLSIIIASAVINLILSINTFSISNLIIKVSELCKYLTFPITMLFFYKYIENGNKIHLKTLVYSATIYATVMIIARLTGTQNCTYVSAPQYGHSGWYYSGNEISALLSMFYPIIIYFASKYRSKSMIFAISTVTYGLLAIGTKTSFFAISITIVSLFVFEFFMFLITKKKLSKNMLFTVFILLIVLIASAPYSPSLKYMVERFNRAMSSITDIDDGQNGNKKVVQSFVYNGRQIDMAEQITKYKKSGISEKMFGLNDIHRIKDEKGANNTIERDLYDIFFVYGIVGFIVYYTPIMLVLVSFCKKLFSDFKKECNEKNFIMGISVCISLGISYIAGHVLLAPTVALFLSVVLAKLNVVEELEEKNVVEDSSKRMIVYMPKLSTGGMEMALINLLNISVLRKKYAITLVLGYCTDKELLSKLPKDINVRLMCSGKWNKLGKVKACIKYIFELINSAFARYDISICYSYHHAVLSDITRTASPNNIMFMHTDLLNSRSEEERNKLIKKVKFNKFKAIVCVSESAKASLQKLMPDYKGKMFVANNYIDGEKILSLSREKNDGIVKKENEIIFINVSRHFEKAKKISRIIEASDKLIKEGYNFKVLLIGSGEDTKLYENMITDRNLKNTVILKGNQLNPYKYIKLSDCLIVSSEFEGYGIVIDEARVLNIPVISTNVADAKFILENGYGILCEENSADGIYEAMKEFLNNGYELKSKFDYKKFNKKIDNMLLNVCNYCESSDE